jgi:hypothetical protein
MNSKDMEARCKEMMEILWDDARADAVLTEAAGVVRSVIGEPFDGDHIRTEPAKEALVQYFLEVESRGQS